MNRWIVTETCSDGTKLEHRVEFFNKEFHGHNNLYHPVALTGISLAAFLGMLSKNPTGSYKNLSWETD